MVKRNTTRIFTPPARTLRIHRDTCRKSIHLGTRGTKPLLQLRLACGMDQDNNMGKWEVVVTAIIVLKAPLRQHPASAPASLPEPSVTRTIECD